MATIYQNAQGLSVYDFNGQTYNAKTGQPVTSTSTTTTPTTSTYTPTVSLTQSSTTEKPPIPQNLYDQARINIQNGVQTPQQAQSALQSLISGGQYSGSVNTSILFAPLSIQRNGQTLGLNADGSFKNLSANTTASSLNASTGNITNASTGPDISSLPPEFQQVYQQLDQYLQQLQKNGQVLNPNITLDASHVAQFLTQAQNEINPYYANQLKVAKDALTSSMSNAVGNNQVSENDLERKYQQGFRDIASNSADNGFAQSGQRQTQERNLALDTQNTIDANRRQLNFGATNTARTFAGLYGSADLPQTNIGNSPTVTAGETSFNRSGGSSPLYQLTPSVYDGLKGSEQYQQTADIANRQSQLENAFNITQGINQTRQLL